MSSRFPTATAAAGPALAARRRRGGLARRLGSAATPYGLLVPAAAVIVAVLGYPLYFLVRLSFEQYGLFELIRRQGEWIGTRNYAEIFHDATFWHVVARTLAFTAVDVVADDGARDADRAPAGPDPAAMRLLLTAGLVFVWATPVVVAVDIWQWMVDFEFGVVNWLLTKLHLGDFNHHDWFENPWTGWAVITTLVVWGAIPFVAIMVYAGLTQVPQELVEAASIDGARGWQVFRDVTFPLLKPIFVILISLSIIWDFQVFTQVWVMLDGSPAPEYSLMSVYAYQNAFVQSEYGLGSAIALVMVVTLLVVSFFYIRQMVKMGETR